MLKAEKHLAPDKEAKTGKPDGRSNGSSASPPEEDLLPEFCSYPDEGCQLAPSCLNCTLESCIEDTSRPWGRQKYSQDLRNREIVRLHEDEKMSIKSLAARFNMGVSTIKRIIKETRFSRTV